MCGKVHLLLDPCTFILLLEFVPSRGCMVVPENPCCMPDSTGYCAQYKVGAHAYTEYTLSRVELVYLATRYACSVRSKALAKGDGGICTRSATHTSPHNLRDISNLFEGLGCPHGQLIELWLQPCTKGCSALSKASRYFCKVLKFLSHILTSRRIKDLYTILLPSVRGSTSTSK